MKWLLKIIAIRSVLAIIFSPIIRVLKLIGLPFQALFSPIHSFWERIPKFKRHFISNFFIGVLIAVILHMVHHTSLVSQFENLAMDSMMVLNQGTERMMDVGDKSESSLAFTFIDVDENSYRNLG